MKSKLLRQILVMSKYAIFGFLLQAIFYSLLIASDGVAQKQTSMEDIYLSIDLEEATLAETFKVISEKTNFKFALDQGKINLQDKVTTKFRNESLSNIFREISRQEDLKFRRVNDMIFVTRKKGGNVIDLNISEDEMLQSKTISGRVTSSEDNEGLPGVNVIVKGTSQGTVTDVNGEYKIDVLNRDAILVFSSVGYQKAEIAVEDKTMIDVTMAPDIQALQEIVVVGYGEQKKANLTGAVSTVKSDELVKSSVSNISQTLVGRVPGIITKQISGEPGNDYANISIRGFGPALVIVDGIESTMNNLDPNEIESISVLKDASAAVYGARAGNGVILITTKRGKISKPTFTFNSIFSEQGYTLYPRLLEAGRYAELIREGQLNAGIPESSLRFTEEQVQKYKEGTEPGYQSTDWFDAVMKKYSPLQQYNLSFRGGNNAVKYYSFLGYTGQTGMYRSGDNKLNRYNIRSNVDAQINKNFSIGLDLSLITSRLQSPIRAQVSLWQDLEESQPVYPAHLPDPTKIAYTGMVISTLASTTRELGGYNDSNGDQIFSTLNLKYLIPGIEGLSVKGLVNYIKYSSKSKAWAKQYSMWAYEPETNTYLEKAGAISTSLNEGYYESHDLTGQIYVNYDRVFAQKHNLSVLLLTEMSSYNDLNISASNRNYITTAIDYLFAGGADSQFSNGSASETGRLSYVGRINYAFNDKYLFETTMRYDGSPKFPPDKRWGFFPSVSAGWRITEEPFIKGSISWLDNLKLRAGFSKTGYDDIGAFQYLTGFNFANRYVVDEVTRTGLKATGLANPNITWEEMTIYNIGLDFSMFSNKLYGELDVFYRDRWNILATRAVSLPTTFGATLPQENINSQNNRGFELMAGYKNIDRAFTYDISANISWARAKWDHYDEPNYTDPDDIRIKKVSGNWANRWFGYQSDGLFTSQEEIDNYALDQDNQENASLKPGDIKYIDQNNDNKLDWRDQIQMGTGDTPEIMYGLNVNLAYKNFDLSILGQGAARYQYRLNLQVANEGNMAEIIYDLRWTEENNDKWAKMPRIYIGGKTNNNFNSDYWLYDASYFRIKVLNLGYNLPASLLKSIGVDNLRVYFAGTNLFTFSGMNKFSIDPEAPSGTRAGLSYPQQKVYSFGINLSF